MIKSAVCLDICKNMLTHELMAMSLRSADKTLIGSQCIENFQIESSLLGTK